MSKPRLISTVERDTSQVSYSSTGRSATWASRTGPARPCSGETTLSLTWRSRQSATSPPTSPGSMRSEAKITRSTPPDSASKASMSCSSTSSRCMSGKSSSLRRIISARSPSPSTAVTSRRGQPAPRPAGGAAQEQRRRPRRRPRRPPRRSADLAGRGLREDERQQRDAGRGPGGDRRQLVDGQVADRDVVAVVEADQLRDHDPRRQQDQRPERVRRRRGDHQARSGGGDQVGEREHAAAKRVAPEAWPAGPCVGALRDPEGPGSVPRHLIKSNPRAVPKGALPWGLRSCALSRDRRPRRATGRAKNS